MSASKMVVKYEYDMKGRVLCIKHITTPSSLIGNKSFERFVVQDTTSGILLISFFKEGLSEKVKQLISFAEEIDRLSIEFEDDDEAEGIGYKDMFIDVLNESFNNYFNRLILDFIPIVQSHFKSIKCTSNKHPLFWAKELFEKSLKKEHFLAP